MDIKEGYRAILFTCIKKAAVAPRSRKEHLLNYWLALEKYSKPPERRFKPVRQTPARASSAKSGRFPHAQSPEGVSSHQTPGLGL